MRLPRPAATAALTTAGLVLVGCSGSADPTTGTTATPTATGAPANAEPERVSLVAVAAYASLPFEPESPELRRLNDELAGCGFGSGEEVTFITGLG